jgi:hypothetical protein
MYKRAGLAQDPASKQAPTPSTSWVNKTPLVARDNVALNKEQLQNARTIVGVGQQMKANRKVIVSAIMTAIDESNLVNVNYGDRDSVGLFQQRDSWGSTEDRMNPETSARLYYNQAIDYDTKYPHVSLNDLCQGVQISGTPYAYGQFQERADRIVTAAGIVGGLTETSGAEANGSYNDLGAGGQFYYYRGNIDNRLGQKIRKPENTWTCIQRLADDVNWRAFFVSGTFYYISEDDLIKQQPAFTMNEWSDGIINVDGNFYEHKDSAALTVTADVGRWQVPPGRLVVVEDMGPWDGRWLVSDFERSLFDSQATITLARERPGLPEPNPKGGNKTDVNPTWVPKPVSTKAGQNDLNYIGTGDYSAIVVAAKKAVEVNKTWHYHYPGDEGGGGSSARPIPDSLWSADAHSALDCSAFVTLCYKEAGAPDPNGSAYNGDGFTGTLAKHGKEVSVAKPGDLQFYGDPPDFHHVTVNIGDGLVASCGSEAGPRVYSASSPVPAMIRTYLT